VPGAAAVSSFLDEGARLGHYEIVAVHGKGGMGEVYLAQDTRLALRVALKILPAALAVDSDRLHRFIREAKSAWS
jgi:serine/threonine protein kinase